MQSYRGSERPILTADAELMNEKLAMIRRALEGHSLQRRVVKDLEGLLLYFDKYGGTNPENGCMASVATIADHRDMAERTVERRLRWLANQGFLECRTRSVRGRTAGAHRWILWDRIAELAAQSYQRQQASQTITPSQDDEADAKNTDRHFCETVRQFDATDRHFDATDRQFVGHINTYKYLSIPTPPPEESSPSSEIPRAREEKVFQSARSETGPAAKTTERTWLDLQQRLTALGSKKPRSSVEDAQRLGLSPAEALAEVEYYLAHQQRWKRYLAPLAYRFREGVWPDAAPETQNRQAADERRTRQSEEYQNALRLKREQVQQLHQRLARWGPRLRTLTAGELRHLLSQRFEEEQTLDFYCRLGIQNTSVQELVVELWEAESEVPV